MLINEQKEKRLQRFWNKAVVSHLFSGVLLLYSHNNDSGAGMVGLLGMELILFVAACMMLCFRFVTKTGLITHKSFSYC